MRQVEKSRKEGIEVETKLVLHTVVYSLNSYVYSPVYHKRTFENLNVNKGMINKAKPEISKGLFRTFA